MLEYIKTFHIKGFLKKKEKVEQVEEQIRVLKAKLKNLRGEKEETELVLLEAMHKGVKNLSKLFTLAITEHDTLPYINWRKEFETNYPQKYKRILASYGRNEYEELVVAKKEVE